jgi:hypothetical protein
MRLILAIRVFFAVLFDAAFAARVKACVESPTGSEVEPKKGPPITPRPEAPKPPVRSDAITLLATLQREARFIDLVQEPLDQYPDEQVGAAARDVIRDCRAVLDRLFALRPVVLDEEGAKIDVPAGFDQGRFRMTGNVAGEPPFSGSLVHHGWEASKCEVPVWTGSTQAALVVAPVEVEL